MKVILNKIKGLAKEYKFIKMVTYLQGNFKIIKNMEKVNFIGLI